MSEPTTELDCDIIKNLMMHLLNRNLVQMLVNKKIIVSKPKTPKDINKNNNNNHLYCHGILTIKTIVNDIDVTNIK